MNPLIYVIFYVRLSFNAAYYFQLKKIIYFFMLFFNDARKSCAPFTKILFPHEKLLHGKILPGNLLPAIHPLNTKMSPWKRLYTS